MDEEFDVEICRDLKRLAGIVYHYGYTDQYGREAVSGTVALSGPVLVYLNFYRDREVPGFYSIEQILKAVETMYGEPAKPKGRHNNA